MSPRDPRPGLSVSQFNSMLYLVGQTNSSRLNWKQIELGFRLKNRALQHDFCLLDARWNELHYIRMSAHFHDIKIIDRTTREDGVVLHRVQFSRR